METDPLAGMIEKAFKEARSSGLSISDAAQIVASVIREKLEQRIGEAAEMNRDMISVQSIYGAKSGLPLVDFKYGLEHFTLDVDSAREHGLAVLKCAEAAVHDASVYRWMTLEAGMPVDTAQHALAGLRRFRGDVDREDWRTEDQRGSDGPIKQAP